MIRFIRIAAAGALALAASSAFAHGYKLGDLQIGHPWSRATPSGAKVGGGYLSIENKGAAPDRLVSVSAPFAGRTEIHEMATKDGVMTMRPMADGVPVPPGQKVEFKPGGYHIMFMDLKAPLKQGEKVKGTLTFEKAGTVEVEFQIDAIGAKTEEHKH